MNQWRLLDTGSHDAPYNMAIDEAIATTCRNGKVPPTLRFYTWNSRSLSIGYFQRVYEDFDQKQLQKMGVTVVRRITGGRAVPHERDLTYSVICPTNTSLFPKDLVGTFTLIARGLVAGLNRVGLPAELSSEKVRDLTPGRAALCFLSLSRWEIVVRGQKIAGSAQRRWKDLFLQHGSLLLDGDAAWIAHCLKLPSEEMREQIRQEMVKKTTSCARILGRPIPLDQVKREIGTGIEETVGITLRPGRLTPSEEEMTARLVQEKYSQPEWNRYPRASPWH